MVATSEDGRSRKVRSERAMDDLAAAGLFWGVLDGFGVFAFFFFGGGGGCFWFSAFLGLGPQGISYLTVDTDPQGPVGLVSF